MNLLATLNANYLNPLMVLLQSVLDHTPEEPITMYILHSSLTEEDLQRVRTTLPDERLTVVGIEVPADMFSDAPVSFHFTKEMYYRIFAARFLPESVDRILYLDPDMVTLNSLHRLYNLPFGDSLLVAASSFNKGMQVMHRLRLRLPEDQVYFNSGMLLMNIARLREEQDEQEIYSFLREREEDLKLPDQDILNCIYGDRTIIVNPLLYNFDVRYFPFYNALPSTHRITREWLEENTVILHYCGKNKPFKPDYQGALEEYYTDIADRLHLGLVGESPDAAHHRETPFEPDDKGSWVHIHDFRRS